MLLKFFRWRWGLLVYFLIVFIILFFSSPPFYVSAAIVIAALIFPGWIFSTPNYKGPVTDHFDGKKFHNQKGIEEKGMLDVIKWMMNRDRGEWNLREQISIGAKPEAKISSGVRITFINHSSFLIQLRGINILLDPVYSERVSPSGATGPKRKRPPGILFNDLPHIDYLLLTHNHYDHLDIVTVKKIHEKFHPKIITPLGIKVFLANNKINDVTEMDWWDEMKLTSEIELACVPAQHFSGRGMFDRDRSLWCGFVLKIQEGNIYIAGDTGYNDSTFKEIGTRYAPVVASIIPIGAYKPRWFMSPIHVSPDEAVKIHQDLKSQKSIACHFGTFPLADEGKDDPVNDLKAAMVSAKIPDDDFVALKEGDWIEV